jgi:hypothetical protein
MLFSSQRDRENWGISEIKSEKDSIGNNCRKR